MGCFRGIAYIYTPCDVCEGVLRELLLRVYLCSLCMKLVFALGRNQCVMFHLQKMKSLPSAVASILKVVRKANGELLLSLLLLLPMEKSSIRIWISTRLIFCKKKITKQDIFIVIFHRLLFVVSLLFFNDLIRVFVSLLFYQIKHRYFVLFIDLTNRVLHFRVGAQFLDFFSIAMATRRILI